VLLNVHEWGDPAGAPVLCAHGVTGHGARFRELASRLPGARVIGVDLRGHGRSGADPPWDISTHIADLLETASALEIDRARWIGHSFGGRIVAELSTAAPDRVERVVLLDPAMHIAPDVALERAELLREDLSFATPDEAIDARLTDGSLFTTPRSILEEEAGAHLEQGADSRWRWRFSPVAAIVAWSEMSEAPPPFPHCPTLCVLGARSWIPVDVPDATNVEVVTVPGGHSVLWDDFETTADAVAAFLG
jgi:lipase